MTNAYQRLAAEVSDAGGRLVMPPGALSLRLGSPVDNYSQYDVVGRNLQAVGLTARFRADGTVSITAASTPSSAPEPDGPTSVSGPTAKQVGTGLYALLLGICTFFPALAHQLLPGGEVGEKQDAFFAIYFATFPLSLAATFIFLMLLFGWFDDGKQRLGAAGAAIVISSVWGIGFGMSYADLTTISQLHGPLRVIALDVVVLALVAYATFYGWALFIAGWLSSLFAALWIKEKADKLLD